MEASKNSSSELKYGWEVISISQTADNVVVEAVNVNSGEKKTYRALYAVGCDGGKSFVRKSTKGWGGVGRGGGGGGGGGAHPTSPVLCICANMHILDVFCSDNRSSNLTLVILLKPHLKLHQNAEIYSIPKS